jgi:hypothetical protein
MDLLFTIAWNTQSMAHQLVTEIRAGVTGISRDRQ